jgi:lysozyme family protein
MAKGFKAPTYRIKWPVYAEQWDRMKIKASRRKELDGFVSNAIAGKDRYVSLEKRTGVPWWLCAIIAERESGQDWSRSLAQGDRWNRKSVNVPRGRGPFKSWEDAAADALHLDNLDDVQDWRLEKALYFMERFNGWGYYFRGLPSAYIWGATNIQKPGKFVRDGVWSGSTMDSQLGCAAMLRALMDTDQTIQPIRET